MKSTHLNLNTAYSFYIRHVGKILFEIKKIPYYRFGYFFLSSFMVYYFLSLVIYAKDILSPLEGIYAGTALCRWLTLLVDTHVKQMVFSLLGFLASIGMLINWKRRFCISIVVFCWMIVHLIIYPIFLPSDGSIGFLLLLLLCYKGNTFDRFPDHFIYLLRLLMALGYTVSGLHKLYSPSWISGDAIRYSLLYPNSYDHFLVQYILSLPPIFLKCLTWGFFYLELFYLPLFLFRPFRNIIFYLMTIYLMGTLFCIKIGGIVVGSLIFHFFAWNKGLNIGIDWKKMGSKTYKMFILFLIGSCNLILFFGVSRPIGRIFNVPDQKLHKLSNLSFILKSTGLTLATYAYGSNYYLFGDQERLEGWRMKYRMTFYLESKEKVELDFSKELYSQLQGPYYKFIGIQYVLGFVLTPKLHLRDVMFTNSFCRLSAFRREIGLLRPVESVLVEAWERDDSRHFSFHHSCSLREGIKELDAL
jgi:hypothetical protein